MFSNVLQYLMTDLYWGLHLMKCDEDGVLYREDYKQNIVDLFKDPEDVPDGMMIEGVNRSFDPDGHPHTTTKIPSLSCSKMSLIWGEKDKKKVQGALSNTRLDIIPHRMTGPCEIHMTNVRKWHKHGVLHRRGGNAIQISFVKFQWGRNGNYMRDSGPCELLINDLKIKARDGVLLDQKPFDFSSIGFHWNTLSNQRISESRIQRAVLDNDIQMDILATDSVFATEQEEMIFLSEIMMP